MNEEWTYEEKVSFVTRILTGDASDEEQSSLNMWLEDPGNKAVYDEISQIWGQAGTVKGARTVDVDSAWLRFEEEVIEQEPVGELPVEKQASGTLRWVWYAAAAVAIFAVTYLVFLLPADDTIYQTAQTTREISLPDGSEVTLNANSRLSFSADFGKEIREVELQGEAFFDVERDESIPFVILTKKARVEVLGTSFNVSAYDQDKEVVVVVTTGVVKVLSVEKGTDVTLEEGDKAVLDRATGTVASLINQDLNYLSWKTRKIILEDITLQEAVALLNKVYAVDIQLSDSAMESCTITAEFDNQSVEEVMAVISASLGIEYIKTEDGFELKGDGC